MGAHLFSTAESETVLNFWSISKRGIPVQHFETQIYSFVWDCQLASQIAFFCLRVGKHWPENLRGFFKVT